MTEVASCHGFWPMRAFTPPCENGRHEIARSWPATSFSVGTPQTAVSMNWLKRARAGRFSAPVAVEGSFAAAQGCAAHELLHRTTGATKI